MCSKIYWGNLLFILKSFTVDKLAMQVLCTGNEGKPYASYFYWSDFSYVHTKQWKIEIKSTKKETCNF